MRNPFLLRGCLCALAVLASDLMSKEILRAAYAAAPPPWEVAPFFRLVEVWNSGISFGMLSGGVASLLLVALTGAIAVGVACWLWRAPDRATGLALGAVLGGAVGNIVDRLRFGAVFDFLDFHLWGYHWPAFNVADSAIVLGVMALAWRSLRAAPDHTCSTRP